MAYALEHSSERGYGIFGYEKVQGEQGVPRQETGFRLTSRKVPRQEPMDFAAESFLLQAGPVSLRIVLPLCGQIRDARSGAEWLPPLGTFG